MSHARAVQQRAQRGELRLAVKAVPVQPVKQLRAVPERFGRGGLPGVLRVFAADIAAQIQALRPAHRNFQHGRVGFAQMRKLRKIALREAHVAAIAEARGLNPCVRGVVQRIQRFKCPDWCDGRCQRQRDAQRCKQPARARPFRKAQQNQPADQRGDADARRTHAQQPVRQKQHQSNQPSEKRRARPRHPETHKRNQQRRPDDCDGQRGLRCGNARQIIGHALAEGRGDAVQLRAQSARQIQKKQAVCKSGAQSEKRDFAAMAGFAKRRQNQNQRRAREQRGGKPLRKAREKASRDAQKQRKSSENTRWRKRTARI